MATALITGASAGLGAEFAKLFAADKHDLLLVARRRDRLDAVAAELSAAHGVKVHVLAADLMDPAAPRAILDEVERLGLEVGFLVNNAGFGSNGSFWELDADRERGMVEVNVTSLVVLTRALLPAMVKRGSGRVLNVGSMAGFQPGPLMATYFATKAFVNTFTEGLAYELEGTGVTATLSCPGATHTEFAAIAGNDKSNLFKMGAMSGPEVAASAYRAMLKGQRVVVHGASNKVSAWTVGFLPRAATTAIAAFFNRRRD